MRFLKKNTGIAFSTLLVGFLAYGQIKNTAYKIEAELNVEEKTITVSQTLRIQNNTANSIHTIYLQDWSNAYENAETPLSKRLAEEFDSSFYFSKKSSLGRTVIETLSQQDIPLVWRRMKENPDIIEVFLYKNLKPNEIQEINIQYEIKIPDHKFTGMGHNKDGDFILRHWNIELAPFINNQWVLNSHLDLEDNSHLPATYEISWQLPKSYHISGNLNEMGSHSLKNTRKKVFFTGKNHTKAQFYLSQEENVKRVAIDESNVVLTDFYPKSMTDAQIKMSLERITRHAQETLGSYRHKKHFVLELDYEKSPFYGLSQFPSFLNIFSDTFLYELKFYKASLTSYLNEMLPIDKRKEHWILDALLIYSIMDYVERYYPDQKFLGRLASWKILKSYHAAKAPFNDGYLLFYDFMERMNLQQADYEEKHKLIKFNEKIASPYHSGLGLKFLEAYIGEKNFKNALKDYLATSQKGAASLHKSVLKFTEKDVDWLFEDYFKKRNAYDLKIKKISTEKGRIKIQVSEKNKRAVPFTVGFFKKDSLLKECWIAFQGKDTLLQFKKREADFVAINPRLRFPEFNTKNNWKRLNSKWPLKPLELKPFKDFENPKKEQLFYLPTFGFNSYDGLSVGMGLYNQSLNARFFEFNLTPQYGLLSKNPVGYFSGSVNFRKEDTKNYLTSFSLFGTSYHYDTDLRYTIFVPQLSFFYRTPDFRSNKMQSLNFAWFNVQQEQSATSTEQPNYGVFNASHTYSDRNTIQYLTTDTSIEASKSFGKFQFTLNYRKLFPSGRRFSVRFFGGKFLWNKNLNTSFFDFNINNPNDYLFQYNYLARSDETGFYSQQFVDAEGAFKSKFENSTSNDFMLTTNMYMGIWKWVELYADVGVFKNRGEKGVKTPSDVGIRLGLVPDYFELFFPIASSKGWEITQPQYPTKIRFLISLDPEVLGQLFSRKWF